MSKTIKLACTVALAIATASCTQVEIDKFNRDMAAINARNNSQAAVGAKPPAMAVMPAATKEEQTQLIVPPDPRTREAMEAALPTVKKILAIHQCVKEADGTLQLNYWAVPGENVWGTQIPLRYMRYHDQSKCVSIRSVDNWSMPALNALKFRAVYFADDSGETMSLRYEMRKMDDGAWRLWWWGI